MIMLRDGKDLSNQSNLSIQFALHLMLARQHNGPQAQHNAGRIGDSIQVERRDGERRRLVVLLGLPRHAGAGRLLGVGVSSQQNLRNCHRLLGLPQSVLAGRL